MIRHSGAKNCRIGLSRHGETQSLWLRSATTAADARRPAQAADAGPAGRDRRPAPGTGLRGMSERL